MLQLDIPWVLERQLLPTHPEYDDILQGMLQWQAMCEGEGIAA
jgi:hypothetical protein